MKERKKISFLKEIRPMMYGFGDDINPRQDTAEVLQEYIIGYLKGILIQTQNMAKIKGKTKTDDLLYILKRDRKKYMRVKSLLKLNEELKRTTKAFDYDEYEKEC